MEQLKKNDEREPGLWPAPRPRHSEFNASQAPGLSNTRYNPKISPKTVFSKTLSQSAFPAKNSFVALKVEAVETG